MGVMSSTLHGFSQLECAHFWWYVGGMKVKTSLTLSEDLIAGIDRAAGPEVSRSAYIEAVLRKHLEAKARALREARDLELYRIHADELNAEAMDVLTFQAELAED
jgi:Arc/MetJ-type ribon-helix-helix transcriptional regulator